MANHIYTDEDFVVCPYCSFKSKILNNIHLKNHSKTLDDLLSEFPECKTCTTDYIKNINEKRKKAIKSKYGVDNISQIKEISEKMKEGIKASCKNAIIKRKATKEKLLNDDPDYYKKIDLKSKKTKLERYGDENYNNIKKSKETKLKKYGDENFVNREKTNQTNLERYGSISPTGNTDIASKISETRNRKMIPKVLKFLDEVGIILEDDYLGAHSKHKFKCAICGTYFEKCWNEIQQGYTCPICYPRYQSSKSIPQKEVEDYINSLGIETISNTREIIKPFELDIFATKEKIAIEYCGFAYHHEEILTETRKIPAYYYHQFKLNECIKQDIRLITIFEDEWIFKRDIVKDRLKQIFRKFDGERIHARKCEIKEIDATIKNQFLDSFHIQGADSSIIKLGAFYNNELVSLMTFSHGNISKGSSNKEKVWELNRFCSNPKYHIPGISSRLLETFKRNFEWDIIFSYSDRRWFDGRMYISLGFSFDGFTKPNYWYINLNKGPKRIHRFQLRKRDDEPEDIPEWVLRRKENYIRIWDCGHQKFILYNKIKK